MSKSLIIYFSITGNTKRVAQQMARKIGADLYQIDVENPYTSKDLEWIIPNCRANVEQKDSASRPAYHGKLPDISQYDTVIFGHPTWWGIPPRIIYTVIEALDLTGKKVASFATSGGSTYSDAQIEMDNLLKNPVKGRILSSETSINSWLADNGLIS